MHSKIFQITETKVAKDNYLNENTLEQGDGNYYDYCSEIDDNERKLHITNLVDNILPKGMFVLVEADVIRYNGGADKWKEEFVAGINEMENIKSLDPLLYSKLTHQKILELSREKMHFNPGQFQL